MPTSPDSFAHCAGASASRRSTARTRVFVLRQASNRVTTSRFTCSSSRRASIFRRVLDHPRRYLFWAARLLLFFASSSNRRAPPFRASAPVSQCRRPPRASAGFQSAFSSTPDVNSASWGPGTRARRRGAVGALLRREHGSLRSSSAAHAHARVGIHRADMLLSAGAALFGTRVAGVLFRVCCCPRSLRSCDSKPSCRRTGLN